ncbi:MAG: DUF456 domain-containing protein [Betaproteobacteria bacterium]|nr:MAG: DUF456 domain-containing protein [Betaproteobacteria bacterium]
MDATAGLWILAIALMAVGLLGTVLPALPGVILVLAGVVVGAWIDDFTRVPGWVVGLLVVIAVIAWVTDYAATVLGAKKAGASKLALVGAAVGTVLGLLMGLVGVLFMPLVGAAVGQYLSEKNSKNAAKVGIATWIGLLVGTVVKLALVFAMLGIFWVAYLW